MIKEFRDFLLRGSVVDLAAAVVIGAAFAALVNSLVSDLLTPVVGAIIGKPDFSNLRVAEWSNAPVLKTGVR